MVRRLRQAVMLACHLLPAIAARCRHSTPAPTLSDLYLSHECLQAPRHVSGPVPISHRRACPAIIMPSSSTTIAVVGTPSARFYGLASRCDQVRPGLSDCQSLHGFCLSPDTTTSRNPTRSAGGRIQSRAGHRHRCRQCGCMSTYTDRGG